MIFSVWPNLYSAYLWWSGPYSPTILENILSLILQNFLYLEASECNTTSDWLNRTVYPIRSCVTNLGEKTKNVFENDWSIRTPMRKSFTCITCSLIYILHFFAGNAPIYRSSNGKTPLKKKSRHRIFYRNSLKIHFVHRQFFYTHLLTWSFNFARDSSKK